MLPEDAIHIWRARLDVDAGVLERLLSTLAPDELARAGRFHFQRDRNRYVAARGALRDILSRYLNTAPAQAQFDVNAHGKPYLKQTEASRGPRLCFNVTHSHDLALYAITYGREVGIDVERVRADLALAPIAERFFTPSEVMRLRSLPAHQQPLAFFHGWTRKEAFVKARGEGIAALPLDRFEVSIGPEQPPALLHVADDPAAAGRWSLYSLAPAPGCVAALAVEGRGWRISAWDWAQPQDTPA